MSTKQMAALLSEYKKRHFLTSKIIPSEFHLAVVSLNDRAYFYIKLLMALSIQTTQCTNHIMYLYIILLLNLLIIAGFSRRIRSLKDRNTAGRHVSHSECYVPWNKIRPPRQKFPYLLTKVARFHFLASKDTDKIN